MNRDDDAKAMVPVGKREACEHDASSERVGDTRLARGVSSSPVAPVGADDYHDFLATKRHYGADSGFSPLWLPDFLFDFQRVLVEWAIRKGRAAIFADTGLGKTPMALVWAENVIRQTNRPVLILTPLAVGAQFIREAEKFGIHATRAADGRVRAGINVANYERLHYFAPADFAGVVCDESSILKSFDAKTKAAVTEFLRRMPYRLLCTATAAPNDYIELGTSSEALGYLGFMDMLNRFFRNDNNTSDTKGRYRRFAAPRVFEQKAWRFKRHAEEPFWRWVCSWARALRRPSDLGFDDGAMRLPPLEERKTMMKATRPREGFLFDLPAMGLHEERELRRRTIRERCAKVADLVSATEAPALVWCHLNAEGDLLASSIPDGQQISGLDCDDAKEEKFLAFMDGDLRVLITKPKIGAWGLNLQHCAHLTYFPSYSYEAYYQAVRRCWRYGQTRPVIVDLVGTEADEHIARRLKEKGLAADTMFASLVRYMRDALTISRQDGYSVSARSPVWL